MNSLQAPHTALSSNPALVGFGDSERLEPLALQTAPGSLKLEAFRSREHHKLCVTADAGSSDLGAVAIFSISKHAKLPTLNRSICPEASTEGRMEDGEAIEVLPLRVSVEGSRGQ